MHVKTDMVGKYVGKEVEVEGWVHRLRDLGKKTFIVIRDSNNILQIVTNPENIKGKIDVEAYVKVKGIVNKDERAPTGYEIKDAEVEVIAESASDWPFHRYLSTEMEMDYRHLWIRSTKMQKIMKVKGAMLKGARKFFDSLNFYEVTPPIFVSSACEGGSTLFEVKYFDKIAYLSQSAQLYLEALIYSLEKVYSLTPSFRAEKSRTRKHLTEYWHLEAEAIKVNWKENMEIQERLIKSMINEAFTMYPQIFDDFKVKDKVRLWIEEEWPKISYDEAIELLQDKGVNIKWGDDIGADEEKILLQQFTNPVFIYRWPKEAKVFYMIEDEEDRKYVLNDDLLMPGVGEIIGGSEREYRLDRLLENMKYFNLDPKDYEWYLDLRKYGSLPHSGFGVGVERVVMGTLGLEHIRDATPFPRTINRVYP